MVITIEVFLNNDYIDIQIKNKKLGSVHSFGVNSGCLKMGGK